MSRSVPLVGVLASLTGGLVAGLVWALAGSSPHHATAIGIATFLAGSALPLLAADRVPLWAARRTVRRHGITLSAEMLPVAASLDTIVLDKDGTVTTGALRVISVDPLDPRDDQNLRWFAGALTHASDDRVGRAVARLSSRGKLTNVEVVDGQGVRGSVDRHPVRVGAPQWVGVTAPALIGRCVGVEVDGRPFGTITVGDSIRPKANESVERLRTLGVEPVLASTDSDANTRHVGAEVGITRFLGFADPAMMATEISELRARGSRVGYVGVPATGGPAETADLAIGPHSTAAQVTMDDLDVGRLPVLVTSARRALARRRAMVPATAVGAAALGLVAALGLLSVPLAAIATVALTLLAGAFAAS